MEFRWNEWNIEHLWRHGVSPEEAETLVRTAKRPFPKHRGDGRWLAWGRGFGGRLLQAVFVIDPKNRVYVIHARPLNEAEKQRFRRRQKP